MNQPQGSAVMILVVDDEADVVAELVETLSRAGHTCQSAGNAQDALELAHRVHPELIISDINLAGQSGMELCAQIKDDAQLADVPVIFLSGAQIPHVVRRSHEVGGTYYLRKPFDPDVLLDLVDKALWMPHLVSRQLQS